MREAAQSRAGSMQEIFEKLDRQDRRRKRWRFLRRWTENATGFVGLLIWLALVAAVLIVVVWAFFEFGLPYLKQLINAR